MSFKNLEGQLARWLEELSQYNMEVVHRKGKDHADADALSRIPDELVYCECYSARKNIALLLCGGCAYCVRAQRQWGEFEENVDDVTSLSPPTVHLSSQMSISNIIKGGRNKRRMPGWCWSGIGWRVIISRQQRNWQPSHQM
jgi:hypothetical protein